MSQLTQQIAGAYIGAPIEWQGNRTAKVIDVIDTEYLPDCRLILTPISVISDEDALEVARIANVFNPIIEKNEQCIILTGDNGKTGDKKIVRSIRVYFHWSNARCYYGNYEVIEYCLPIADYLRSRNYDLGYMGIKSLIDAGIAISSLDKTDSNVQP